MKLFPPPPPLPTATPTFKLFGCFYLLFRSKSYLSCLVIIQIVELINKNQYQIKVHLTFDHHHKSIYIIIIILVLFGFVIDFYLQIVIQSQNLQGNHNW